MKKNKGFTLIELLAVIVVLAIIALIATPIVMNTIKNSKKGAAERSGEAYIKQVETAIVENRVKTGNTVSDGTYEINNDGNICLNSECTEKLDINMNGDKPSSGTIKIINGQVESATDMVVKDYNVSYTSSDNKYVVTEKDDTTPEPEVLCTAITTKVSALVYSGSGNTSEASSYSEQQVGLLASESGNYTAGVTYTCNVGDGERTFYVLEESGDNVSLILGTNLGSTVAWSSDGSNHIAEDESQQAVTAKAYLEEQTSGWTKLNPSQINLPSAEQIATAVGQTFSQTTISGLPTWLRSYTDTNVAYGYWTSTPNSFESYGAWYVACGGSFTNNYVLNGNIGVRPVITIPKTQLG